MHASFRWLQVAAAPLVLATAVLGQWPFHTRAPQQNFTSPAIADLDGDGVLEIVFGSWDGRLYCVSPSGSEIWNLYLSDGPDNDFERPQLHSSATIADVDGNPSTLEVIVGSGHGSYWGRLYVISNLGHELARFDTPSHVMASPLVVDADANGFPEVYFGGAFQPFPYYSVEIVHSAGAVVLIPRWTVLLPEGGSFSAAAAGDLTLDVGLEIVVASSGIINMDQGGKRIYAFRSNGSLLWSNQTQRFNNFASPVLADLDGTGRLSVLQGSTDGGLYCLRGSSGHLRWKFQTQGESLMHTPAVADLQGDARLEIVFGSYDPGYGDQDRLYCLDSLGQVLWERTFPGTELIYSSPAIGDLDRNGTPEIVIGTSKEGGYSPSAFVFALDSSGNTVWSVPQPKSVYSSPALADLNGDGPLEICFGVYNGTYDCLDSTGHRFQFVPGGPLLERSPWPSWHRTLANRRVQE